MSTFSLNVCNLKKRSVFKSVQLKVKHKFESVDDLKIQILAEQSDKRFLCLIKPIGYTEPGHGLHCKQR